MRSIIMMFLGGGEKELDVCFISSVHLIRMTHRFGCLSTQFDLFNYGIIVLVVLPILFE